MIEDGNLGSTALRETGNEKYFYRSINKHEVNKNHSTSLLIHMKLIKTISTSLLILMKLIKLIFTNLLIQINSYIYKKQDLVLNSPQGLICYLKK